MPDIFDPIAWTVARRLGGGNSGGGSGLPAGAKPNQHIVTDGEGNAKWEDKLAYTETGEPLFTLDLDRTVSIHNQKDAITTQGYAFQQTNMQAFALTKNIGAVDLNSLVGSKLTKHNAGGDSAETEVVEVVASDISGDTLTYEGMTLTASGDLSIEIVTNSMQCPGGYVSSLIPETIHPIDKKYLPGGGSGGGVFWVTCSADDSGSVSLNKTFSEIEEAIKAGLHVKATLEVDGIREDFEVYGCEYGFLITFLSFSKSAGKFFISSIQIWEDGTTEYEGYQMTVTAL